MLAMRKRFGQFGLRKVFLEGQNERSSMENSVFHVVFLSEEMIRCVVCMRIYDILSKTVGGMVDPGAGVSSKT